MDDGDVERLSEAVERVENAGLDRLERARELRQTLERVLREYEEKATGHGDFGSYVEARSIAAGVEESVDEDDVHGAEVIRAAAERFDRRTLRPKHFERAASDLEALDDDLEALDDARRLRDELRSEARSKSNRLKEVEDELREVEREVERVRRHDDVDTSAFVDALEAYVEGVRADFDSYFREAPAADVVELGASVDAEPLLPDLPVSTEDGSRLREAVGERTVEEVLELHGYSDSKLSHVVDDPAEFRDAVPVGFLEWFDVEPFTVDVDVEGDVVEHLAPALLRLTSDFASPETLEALRELRRLSISGEYERLRRAYVAAGDSDVDELERRRRKLREEAEALEAEVDVLESAVGRADEVLEG